MTDKFTEENFLDSITMLLASDAINLERDSIGDVHDVLRLGAVKHAGEHREYELRFYEHLRHALDHYDRGDLPDVETNIDSRAHTTARLLLAIYEAWR